VSRKLGYFTNSTDMILSNIIQSFSYIRQFYDAHYIIYIKLYRLHSVVCIISYIAMSMSLCIAWMWCSSFVLFSPCILVSLYYIHLLLVVMVLGCSVLCFLCEMLLSYLNHGIILGNHYYYFLEYVNVTYLAFGLLVFSVLLLLLLLKNGPFLVLW
jgi:hypothetical protein